MLRPAHLILLFSTLAYSLHALPLEGFTPSPPHEQSRLLTLTDNVRLYQSAAEDFDPTRPTLLILYATPNGNTLEWTLGAAGENLDWHYDIQHVAAQTRKLRSIDPTRNIVLAVVQADEKAWTAFRSNHPIDNPERIAAIVQAALAPLPKDTTLLLTGHSGGGAFILGFINAADTIPDYVSRIAFLDANYSYSDEPREHHGDKLLAWLHADPTRHLVVIAYDDREITLDGKKVLSPTGGTWRASRRMIERLSKDTEFTADHTGDFEHQSALHNQIQFFIHPNPENKILHTRLVGEMNGLLQAATVDTPLQTKWGIFGGPRAYTDFVTTRSPTTRPAAGLIPPRRPDAITGSAFVERAKSLTPQDREAAIFTELSAGNIPPFLRQFKNIRLNSPDHIAQLQVMPDYLAIGSDDDFVRIPMTPTTARRLTDAWRCTLPTTKIVDAIYAQADFKLEPRPLTEKREALETFLQHHQIIESQRKESAAPLGSLIAGIKKDVVLTQRLLQKPGHVAIYGWHKLDASPIQPLTTVHIERYVDYSHGIRLIARDLTVDGKTLDFNAALKDKELSKCLTDEGITDVSEMYPEPKPGGTERSSQGSNLKPSVP